MTLSLAMACYLAAAALALIVAGLVALARLTREEDSDPDYARVE